MSNDLKHSDWLITSIEQIIKTIDSTIVISPAGNNITLSEIKADVIDNLVFLTNTDQNNNFFSLTSISVYLDDQTQADNNNSLTTAVKQLWTRSDLVAFIQEKKLHKPFDVSNLDNTPSFTGTTFSEYTDLITGSNRGIVSSQGRKKKYTIVLSCGMDK
jgi:hypothetical protein